MSNDNPGSKKPILSSAEDVRIAAGLFVIEEVDRLLDRMEALTLASAIEKGVNSAFKQAMPVQVKAIDGVITRQLEVLDSRIDDPLSLKKSQPVATSPDNESRLINYLIATVLGVLVGALATYLLMK